MHATGNPPSSPFLHQLLVNDALRDVGTSAPASRPARVLVYLDGDGQPVATAVDFASGAAYGWAVLQGDGYADQLRARVLALDDPRLGLRSGEWRGGKPIEQVDLHTQAMLLEAVLYRSRGGQRLLADAAGSTP